MACGSSRGWPGRVTDQEWGLFMLELGGAFEGEILPEREAALKAFFGRVPLPWAKRVIHRQVLDGRRFVPSPGELVATLRRVAASDWTFQCLLAGESSEERSARLSGALRELEGGGDR